MNIKVHSSDLNRMLKTITQCIDTRTSSSLANIEITHEDNKLSIRGTDGVFSAIMSMTVLGGGGEQFCVDGGMFAKVCAMCNGEISIVTDENNCFVKGVGRTRLPIVKTAKIPAYDRIEGKQITVYGKQLSDCYGRVAYAISTDQSRIQLTGILTESDGEILRMVALDGFQMSLEETKCTGDAVKVIIPGTFMKLVSISSGADDKITLTTNGTIVQAESEGMIIRCGLLAGEFPDYNRILPKEFKTVSRISVAALRDMLKAGNVVNNKQNLVKLEVCNESIRISNISEQAEFEAEVVCATQGDGLKIAFNDKYLMNTMNALDADVAELKFISSTSPVIVNGVGSKGRRLVLPVRC